MTTARERWDAEDDLTHRVALGVAQARAVELSSDPVELDAIADGNEVVIRAVLEQAEAEAGKQPEQRFPEPEDRGLAILSALGATEYVEDLIRPGRIVVWAGEEGSGKSYTLSGELAIRMATAGGSLAGTWPVLRTAPVLVVSEMHPDDDYTREQTVLASLKLERTALAGRYYRLNLMTAAGGEPALDVGAWREWVIGWLSQQDAVLLVIDTATSATRVDPWGEDIRAVFRNLRIMLDAYPALAIVLTVHLKKPQGHGQRRISDVMGEWGRWCDVLVLQENDGTSLTRARLTSRKRVRHERRIIATKAGGLLVDPIDADTVGGPRASLEEVAAAVAAKPGLTVAYLATATGVSNSTAAEYARMAENAGLIERRKEGPRGRFVLYPSEGSPSDLPNASGERVGRSPEGQMVLPEPSTFRASDDSIESEGGRSEAPTFPTSARVAIGLALPDVTPSAAEAVKLVDRAELS